MRTVFEDPFGGLELSPDVLVLDVDFWFLCSEKHDSRIGRQLAAVMLLGLLHMAEQQLLHLRLCTCWHCIDSMLPGGVVTSTV